MILREAKSLGLTQDRPILIWYLEIRARTFQKKKKDTMCVSGGKCPLACLEQLKRGGSGVGRRGLISRLNLKIQAT